MTLNILPSFLFYSLIHMSLYATQEPNFLILMLFIGGDSTLLLLVLVIGNISFGNESIFHSFLASIRHKTHLKNKMSIL